MVPKVNHIYRLFFTSLFISFTCARLLVAQIASIPPSASDTGLGGGNSVVGTVLGPDGRPVNRRLNIRLSTMTRGDRTTMTDERGSFAFQGLPAGNYSVIIDKEKEFEPVSQQVDVFQFRGSPPSTYMVNIRLTVKP